jgi:hypothetical protein
MRTLLLLLISTATCMAQGSAGPCDLFPADNPWNQDVSSLPVHPLSSMFIASIDVGSTSKKLHPDFGVIAEYGIPYAYVAADQPRVPITYDAYGDQSDPGPFPIPPDAPVEGTAASTGDRHVIVVDTSACMLYELYSARKDAVGSGWTAQSGATFDLSTTAYRPDGWTSADAAGLPIFPGLVRFDEVSSGSIDHAVRFTSRYTQRGWIHPARHQAGRPDTTYPPMGLRLRLRSDFDLSAYTGQARVILDALKRYGMILADNGTSWFISGTSDPRWDIEDLNQLKRVPGTAFEAVYTGPIKRAPEVSGVSVGHEHQSSASVERLGDRLIVHGSPGDRVHSVELIDMMGRCVAAAHGATPQVSLDLPIPTIAAGVYLVRIVNVSGARTSRIVIER